ncbi:uncharacterized protein [Atheta coriaria]|uniref:uncharacterized protein n=1 Tax=Dalotia coriaria TaxID=877792 RepID=UPI0031F46BFD
MTRSAPLTQNYKFVKLGDINIRNRFEINFSFLGKSSAQIYLCSNAEVKRGTCFIFILGGWNGEGSVIRRCREGASPRNSEDRLKGCENVVNKIEHRPLFSCDQWSQISIRYVNQQLDVTINDERLLSYHAQNDNEFNSFTRLFIHSNTENALWKYHQYTYYEARKPNVNFINSNKFLVNSNHLHISFLANHAKDITIQLYDTSQELIKTEYYKSDQNTQWNYKTFISDVDESAEYNLRISFSPNDKIAIRNIVRHLDCKESKTDKFHLSTLEYNFVTKSNIKCSSLRHTAKQLNLQLPHKSIDSCPSNKQQECDLYNKLFNTTNCPHRITCNEKSCHCSTGYTGQYCDKKCERGNYGCNCACECGKCVSSFCNPANGDCYFGCNNINYLAPDCMKRNLPVLTGIASTQTDCVTNCTIKIYDKELKYDGVAGPKYYYTRLIQPNRTTTEGELTQIKINIIKFTNLIKESKYAYQIILCVTSTKSNCGFDELTTFEFETTCEELRKDQILIGSIDRRTTINVASYNSNKNCFLSSYYMIVVDSASNSVQKSKHLELK